MLFMWGKNYLENIGLTLLQSVGKQMSGNMVVPLCNSCLQVEAGTAYVLTTSGFVPFVLGHWGSSKQQCFLGRALGSLQRVGALLSHPPIWTALVR